MCVVRDFCLTYLSFYFLFKPKTAYEMGISVGSSDVCSSDLGSRVKTLVVRPLSSLFRKASVIGVELKTFFTEASIDRSSGPSTRSERLKFVQSRRRARKRGV